MLHVTCYILLNYFLQNAVYYNQLKSTRHVVYHDQHVGACYTLNILSRYRFSINFKHTLIVSLTNMNLPSA